MYIGLDDDDKVLDEKVQFDTLNNELTDWDAITPTYKPVDHADQFDAKEYLESFYEDTRSHQGEGAMKFILFALPNIVARMPDISKLRILDVGCGPTFYMALYFRKKAREVYLADFCDSNLQELTKWMNHDPDAFDWSNLLRTYSIQEGYMGKFNDLEDEARAIVKDIIHCNVFNDDVIAQKHLAPFDLVTSVFCLEYASQNFEEYKKAVYNVVQLIKPGGYLFYGGIQHENCYYFGGKRFTSHFLVESEVMEAIEDAGINMDTVIYRRHMGMFYVFAQRLEN